MARDRSPAKSSYQKLLRSIQSTVFGAKQAMERTAVLMYWTVGRQITQYQQGYRAKTKESGDLYRQLGEDLQIDFRTLYQATNFYRAFPKIDPRLPVSWSHYRYLSQIPQESVRQRWIRRIVREGLGVHEFQAMVKAERGLSAPANTTTLPVNRGLLYHYRLVNVRNIHTGKDELMVDCGFENRIVPPASSAQLINKYIYRSDKEDGRYSLKGTKAVAAQLFTYIAAIERVVDGDTLWVNIDCGFGIFRREKLRLRSIDAPELSTIAGKYSKAYLEKKLAEARFVVLKTYWEDKYGRYLADVFMLAGEADPQAVAAQGELLNQDLLDAGMAKIYA